MGEFEDCQVVFSHEVVWDAFVSWLRQRGLKTFPVPIPPDQDLPTYGITFIR